LESFSVQPTIDQGWRDLKANFQNLADFVNVGGSSSFKSSATNGSSSTTVTASAKTNAGSWMKYLLRNNTSQGGPSFFKFGIEVESTVGKTVGVKTPIGEVSGSVETNQDGETTATAELSVLTPDGTVGGSVSQSTDGTTTVSANIGLKTNNGSVKAEASIIKKPDAIGVVSGFGVSKTVGDREYEFNMSVQMGAND
jgi:hypothetical protein